MTRFIVTFRPHLSPERVDHLSGILGLTAIVHSIQPHALAVDVHRKVRVPDMVKTLENWERYGWLSWTFEDDKSGSETGGGLKDQD